jgi:hypothetical protein
MDREMNKGKNKKAMDLIMMEEDQINKIMEKAGKTHSGIPYQYKLMNNKKRAIADKESLDSDEEEVEDIWDVENIEEIMHETYERKTRGLGSGIEGRTLIHITVNVEPTTPCATNTPERTPSFRKHNFSGRKSNGAGIQSRKIN